MRKIGASIALSASLLAGCSSSSEQMPMPRPSDEVAGSSASVTPEQTLVPQTYEEQVADLGRFVTAVQGYWSSQNIDVSHAKVEIVEGNETFSCGEVYSPATVGGGYCHALDTFFATQAFISYINSDQFQPEMKNELSRMEVVVAHEYGHVAQYDKGITKTSADYISNVIPLELQADCFAGQTIHRIDPDTSELVLRPDFVYLPGDEDQSRNTHGTTEQRKQSFVSGYNGVDCNLPG